MADEAIFTRSFSDPYADQNPTRDGVSGSDFAKAFGARVPGMVSDLGSALRYLGEQGDEDNRVAEAGKYLGSYVQSLFGEWEEGISDTLSPAAQEKLNATVTDPAFWSLSSIALKGSAMAPDVVAAVIPAGIVRGAIAATAFAAGTGATFSAAGVTDDILTLVDETSDADLQKQSKAYRDNREQGMDEATARQNLTNEMISLKPLIVGVLGAVTGAIGPAGQAARGVVGAGSSLVGEAERGVVRRAAGGFLEGAGSEAVQSGAETYATQDALVTGEFQDEIDYGAVAAGAAEGAVLGGVLGGGISAAVGRPRARTVVEEALEPSSAVANPAPVSTDTGPATGPVASSGTVPSPVAQAAGAPEVAAATPKVTVVEAAAPDAAQNAALASTEVETPARVNQNSAADVADAVNAVSQVETADQAGPLPTQPQAPEASPAPTLAEPAPIQTPEIAQTPEASTADVSAPPAPVTPEIISNTDAPPVRGRVLEDRTTAPNTTALNDQVARNIASSEAETKTPQGKKRSQADIAAREATRTGATEIAAKFQPVDGEAGIMSAKPKEVTAAKRLIFDRAKAMVDDAKERGLSLPKRMVDNANQGENFNADTLLLMEAQRLVNKKTPSKQDHFRFYEREVSLRKGELDQVKSERRTEGDIAMRRGGENAETQIDNAKRMTSDETNPEARIIARDEAAEQGSAEGDEDTNYRAPDRVDERPLTAAEKRQQEREAKARAIPPKLQEVFDAEIERAINTQSKAAPVVEKVKRRTVRKPEPVKAEPKVTPKVTPEPVAPTPTERAKRVLEVSNERIAKARAETNTTPTDAQKEAGNYKKGKANVHGHTVAIENPKGTVRSGVGPDGKAWSNKMPADYGYITGSKGADGDAVDVYLGPDRDAPYIYVVDQMDPDTFAFDEHKVLMGFKNEAAAYDAYAKAFSDNKPRAGDLRKMTPAEFKRWLDGDTTQRAGASEADLAEAQASSFLTDAEIDALLGDDAVPFREGMVTDPNTGRHAMPRASYKAADVMARLGMSNMNGLERAMAVNVRRLLASAVGDVDVHVLSLGDLAYISRADEAGVRPRGYFTYDMQTGKGAVFIREDQFSNPADAAHVVLHEVTHAATLKAINDNPEIEQQFSILMALTKRGMAQANIVSDQYGLTTPAEFAAEAFSNPEFQKLLASIKMPNEMAERLGTPSRGVLRTVWDMFVSSVRKAIGVPSGQTSMLEVAIRTNERTMKIQQGGNTKAGTGYSSFLIDPRASMQAAQTKVSDMMGREVAGLQRNRGNARFLRVRTLDNIARAADRFFGQSNPIRKIANLMEMQRVAVIKRMDDTAPMIQRLYDLEKTYGKQRGEDGRSVWENFSSLVTDETMSGVYADRPLSDQKHITKNGYRDAQKRAQHAELARRYEALPEPLKKARKEAMDYFRDTQNEMSQKLMENRVLHVLGIEGAEAKSMAERVFNGKETDADKAALGDALDAIKAAGVLKKIEGPYFPLMRRGNWVVKGTYDITAPSGATRLSPNEFEFSSREAASDFAASQGTRANTRTVYVDKTTGDTLGVTADGTQVQISANDMNAEARFRVTVQDRHVEMFDTQQEARRRAAELTAAGIKTDDVVPRRYENFGVQADMLSSQMNRLMGVLERKAGERNYTDQQKSDLMSAMNEMSLHMLASTRIQTRNLPRQFVEGASRDLVRNTTDYSQSTSNYLAKLDFKPRLDAAVKEMHEHIKENSRDGWSTARQQVANEVERRLTTSNPAMEGGTVNAVVQRILAVSFLDKLMSPAYSIVNAAQPIMTAAPMLASHFGPGRTFSAMSKAYNDVGSVKAIREGMAATWGKATGPSRVPTDPVSLIRSRLTNKGEQTLLDVLIERGIIDTDAGLEVGKLVRRGDGVIGSLDGGIGYLEGIARQMPKTVEAINRSVTAVAAYRLEMERSGNTTRAIDFAQDIINQTQFNYSASNSAPFMNHPLLRLVTQFKKYGIGMYQLLGEQAAIAIRNEQPGDRARAIKALSYTVGMHVLAAGAAGLPTEPLKFMLMAAHGLGITDWNWSDVEEAQRNLAADYLGTTLGEMVTRGVSRGVGIDLSTRMGIDSLIGPFGEPRTDDEAGWKAYLWDTFAGAPASLPVDWVKGVHSLAEGDVARAAERLVPIKMFSDSLRAYRQMTEGTVSERTGRQVLSEYSVREGITKAIGFAPAREAESFERSGAFYRNRDAQVEQRSEFNREWSQATGAARGRIWRDVQKWNRTQPKDARITLSELKGYRRRMESDMKATKEGIRARRREEHILARTDATYNFE